MSRKDYEAFAKAIREMPATTIERLWCAEIVAKVCSQDNYRFNRNRFMEACGLENA